MSRIHEALKRAVQERGLAAAIQGREIGPEELRGEVKTAKTVEPVLGPQHANGAKKDRSGLGLSFSHSSLPNVLAPVRPEMMQTVARVYSLLEVNDRVVIITGWDASDRSGDLSLEIARGFASLSRQSVLLVDADFQKPQLHEPLRTAAGPGLAELMDGQRTLKEVIRPSFDKLFFFLPAGASAALQAKGLSVPAWTDTLAALRSFERVVIHVGPLHENAPAMVVTCESDAVILALAAGNRRRVELENLQRQIGALRTKLLGAVLTHRSASASERFLRWR